MSQLVSVTLLHQEPTAPVKNGGLLLNSPFLLVPLFFTSKLQKKRKYHKENEFREKKSQTFVLFFRQFFLEGEDFLVRRFSNKQ